MNEQHSSDSESDPEYNPELDENKDVSESGTSDEVADSDQDHCESEGKVDKSRKKKTKKRRTKRKSDDKDTNESEEKKVKVDVESLWNDFKKDCSILSTKRSVMSIVSISESNGLTNGLNGSANGVPYSPASSTSSFDDHSRLSGTSENSQSDSVKSVWDSVPSFARPPKKVPGIAAVLKQLEKKNKWSVFEKSKTEWDRFKSREGIVDNLKAYNKGKNGYIDKQEFLSRTDLRRFEIEKKARNTRRRTK